MSPICLLGSRVLDKKCQQVWKKKGFYGSRIKMHGKKSRFRHSLTSAWCDFVRETRCENWFDKITVANPLWFQPVSANKAHTCKNMTLYGGHKPMNIPTYPSIQSENMTSQDLATKWSHLKTQSNVYQCIKLKAKSGAVRVRFCFFPRKIGAF